MFGVTIDGKDEIEGLQAILKQIASNDESNKLTHKEVRAYARCMLSVISDLRIDLKLEPEIKILMLALSSSGLPHYDRSFLATKILKLLKQNTKLSREAVNIDDF